MALSNDYVLSNIHCHRLPSRKQLPQMEIPRLRKNLIKRNANSKIEPATTCCCAAASDSMVLIGVFVRPAKPRMDFEWRWGSSYLENCSIAFFQLEKPSTTNGLLLAVQATP